MPFTPFLFLRVRKDSKKAGIWTIVFENDAGRKTQRATKFREHDHAKAKALLRLFIEQRERDARVAGAPGEGPLTVARLAEQWLARRETKGISTVSDYESKLRVHILPVIGPMRADRVRIEDIERVMAVVAAKGRANKTQLRVYETMHAMFGWAVPRLLEASPCGIKGEDLPADIYSKPNFQAEAEFTRAEVVTILTSPLIPIDRRVLYAIIFLGGMRIGEASALLVRHYQRDAQPLGRLLVGHSYNSKKRIVKRTKTEVDRVVPVHPELARLLDWWLDVGWPEMMGRLPGPNDVLVPTRNGTHRDSGTTWRQLNGERDKGGNTVQVGDLERLEMRRRRVHDSRHTFVTLMLDDGARPDLLQLITHGPGRKIIAQYTARPPWKALCAEVLKLEIDLSKSVKPGDLAQREVAKEVATLENVKGFEVVTMRPQRDSNPRAHSGQSRTDSDSQGQTARLRDFRSSAREPNADIGGQKRSMATLATLALRQVLAALDRGRLDEARAILLRAIKDEADERGAAS